MSSTAWMMSGRVAAKVYDCSFCQRSNTQLGSMIEGPEDSGGKIVYICVDCTDLCTNIFRLDNRLPGRLLKMKNKEPNP